MHARFGRKVRLIGHCMAIAAIILGLPVRYALGQNQQLQDPYSPAYGHPYRHGVVPTLEAWQEMRAWEAAHLAQAAISAGTSADTVTYGGGIDGIGVTSGTPRVYLVFYGSQWASGGDPDGAAIYLQTLFSDVGTGSELWSGTMTQYCDGSSVSKGATSCPSGAAYVGYPFMGSLAGVWFDTSSAAPYEATQAQLSAEAVAAAAHFGNTSAASNRYVQYIIASPSGTHPDGFGLGSNSFCAWHNYTTSSYGDIAYTNMPYVADLGTSCGEDFVNKSTGTLDGFSIVGGHEYAETLTDQNPFGGWTNPSTGEEVGDECAWISSGQGAAANVRMGNGTYAMQSIWSNDSNACDISHSLIGTSWSAASTQQCGTFTTSTSNYSGSESYSCTVQVTVSGGSGGYVATATAYPFTSGGDTTVSSTSTVFPGMVTVSGNTVSATYSSSNGWCFPPPSGALYAMFGDCAFPQTIVLAVTDSSGSTQTFGFSIGLSGNASFCPPPGVGDECSETDPLYATD